MIRQTQIAIAAGLTFTAVVAIVFRLTTLDIDLQALAYEPGAGWPHAHRFPWKFLHDFGTLPGLMLALAAIIGMTASFLTPRFARWRFSAFYVFALTALGPGVMTNIFGKILAGRPRPEEVAEFGGAMPFLHPFEFGTPGRGFSFLCGHCSMGYLFVAFFFLARDPRLRWLALAGGSAFGLLLGIARVAAGAHFPSDIVLAGTLTFTLAALLSPIARMQPDAWRRRKALAAWAIAAAVVLLIAFSFSTPINRERTHTFAQPREILIDVDRGDVEVVIVDAPRQPLTITSVVKGFGFPGSDGDVDVIGHLYRHRLDGFLWEAHVKVRVAIPRDSPLQRIRIATAEGIVTAPRDPRVEILHPGSTFRKRVIRLTQPALAQTEYASRMSYTDWLRRQVERLEDEIRRHSVFDDEAPASIAQLRELRRKAVIHTYLKQQLLRRDHVGPHEEEYDTQEFVLVRK